MILAEVTQWEYVIPYDTVLNFIYFIAFSLYSWWAAFILHEDCHIKGQGLLHQGYICSHGLGYTVTVDLVEYPKWLKLSGGLLSGIIHICLGAILWTQRFWPGYVPLITVGMINLIYGFYELIIGAEGRYKIYLLTLIAMALFWMAVL